MKKTVIYTGSRINSGKKYYRYIDAANPGKVFTFSKRKIARVERIGSIVESEVEGDTFKDSKVVGHIDDSHLCYGLLMQWEIDERAALEEIEAIRTSNAADSKLEKAIDEIHNAMCGLSKTQRIRVARYVFEQLTK